MSDNITAEQLAKGVPIEALQKLGFMLDPQEPSNEWRVQKSILVGPPKSGKSTFLAQAGDKSYFLRCAKEFHGIRTWGADITEYDGVKREIAKLHAAKKAGIFPWENIILDPMYRFLSNISDKICDEAGNAPSIYEAGGFGAGQRKYKLLLKSVLFDLEDLPAHKWFVMHSVAKEMKDTNDKAYTRHVIEMSEKLDFDITKLVDNTLHIMVGYSGSIQARSMVTMGTKNIEAGCKAPALKKLPQIPWSADDGANYKAFRALFT